MASKKIAILLLNQTLAQRKNSDWKLFDPPPHPQNLVRSSSPVQSLLNNLPLLFQSSVQDWGEEVEEGAIYNVTLKRVQIQQAANKGARWLGVSWHLEFLHESENTLKNKASMPRGRMDSSADWVHVVPKCHFKGPL